MLECLQPALAGLPDYGIYDTVIEPLLSPVTMAIDSLYDKLYYVYLTVFIIYHITRVRPTILLLYHEEPFHIGSIVMHIACFTAPNVGGRVREDIGPVLRSGLSSGCALDAHRTHRVRARTHRVRARGGIPSVGSRRSAVPRMSVFGVDICMCLPRLPRTPSAGFRGC